eukprot:1143327-Pelagomonas_calceolata.AAC.6
MAVANVCAAAPTISLMVALTLNTALPSMSTFSCILESSSFITCDASSHSELQEERTQYLSCSLAEPGNAIGF